MTAEVRPVAEEWTEVELTTVNQNGEKRTRTIKDLSLTFALNQAAAHMIEDIFEAVRDEALEELPKPRVRATIYEAKGEDVFKVEVKGRNFTRVYHIPKDRATYFYGGFDVKGFYVYIPIRAVYSPIHKTLFYEIVKNEATIRAMGENLYKMIKGEE
jgi:hypothetical protein